ncbi:trimeric intracellular cation channel family protein [Psychrobacter sp. DAB_AL43B]|uniref:trimeric intracellular cation channel family protein n=1 Tax=Psychrobacter sp. DAB_AL43B TaxID=1028416 RepID=UPI001D0CE7BE|nr:trimeric intracellular cation channel family protein [Psychrobacter sp. DAB_AL43B]
MSVNVYAWLNACCITLFGQPFDLLFAAPLSVTATSNIAASVGPAVNAVTQNPLALTPEFVTRFEPTSFMFWLEMFGIFACSVSGTILAKHKNFDVFGCILVAMIAAISGPTARDIILDRYPLFWMVNMNYLLIITITSVGFQIFCNPKARHVDGLLKLFDGLALAIFTLIGIQVAQEMGANIPICILLGVLNILFGGVIRDMLCNEIPLVLQREIYVTAAIIGGILYFVMEGMGITPWIKEASTMMTIFVIRMMAVRYDWHFPDISLMKKHSL